MNRGTYTAAVGMIAQQQRLDVASNNLANVNTRGYKADRLSFRDTLKREVANDAGYGNDVGAHLGGPLAVSGQTDFAQGGVEATGNPFDFMLQGEGMFAVRTPQGETRYTRDGSFKLNASGGLVTQDGNAVLDDKGQPITGLDGKVKVGKNGAITTANGTVTLGRATGTFKKEGYNLFTSTNAQNSDTPVENGALETANINPVTSMVEMIALQRTYEIAQKMIQSQDETTGRLNEVIA